MSLSVIPLGVGDAFSAKHYSCCVAVGFEGQWVLIDCPHPVRKMLREAEGNLDISDVHSVLLTHLHADHSSGIETFGYFCRFALQRKARIACHPTVSARLWDGHLAAGMEQLLHHDGEHRKHTFDDYFELTALTDDNATQIGPFQVECRRTRHHIATTALRISAGGAMFGVSADTTFDPALIAWLAECDVFSHEVGYGVHTPLSDLQGLPRPVRQKMRLIHTPDDVDVGELQLLTQGKMLKVG
jgi:glyoxylase-like metal-dependent hydrolase (beta-lactamase superfamily II)